MNELEEAIQSINIKKLKKFMEDEEIRHSWLHLQSRVWIGLKPNWLHFKRRDSSLITIQSLCIYKFGASHPILLRYASIHNYPILFLVSCLIL
ncbi:unnamed protein product [Trifolium pratense]|uniref:Uncharacterized protein n=1 Tax=Trifolium pratense TaxID=57577 RepID=A0ACB0LJG2_TRIPR|nr:unnamed protein product [Trifolium pratense]